MPADRRRLLVGRVGAPFLAAWLLVPNASATTADRAPFCAPVEAYLQAPALDAVPYDVLPPHLARWVRDEVGRAGDTAQAPIALGQVAAAACPKQVEVDAKAALQAALADERLGGLRTEAGFVDRLLERAWLWVQGLLESEGMQRFAESTRAVYLSILAGIGAVVAWRLFRPQGRHARQRTAATEEQVERARARLFAALQKDAVAALERGEAREACLLLRQALLRRIGEVEAEASHPARTATEILQALHRTHQTLAKLDGPVAKALHVFDDAFYRGQTTVADARAVLAAVEAAAAWLKLRGQARAAGGER
jgi:hypothetical protein